MVRQMDAWMGGWLEEYMLIKKDRCWPHELRSSQEEFEPRNVYFLDSQ